MLFFFPTGFPIYEILFTKIVESEKIQPFQQRSLDCQECHIYIVFQKNINAISILMNRLRMPVKTCYS